MALGKRVAELRESRAWKQAELCDLVNARLTEEDKQLSQQALSNLESRDSATSEAAPYLAEVFNVSLRWLLTGRGRPDDADWPFSRVDRRRWDACTSEDRGYVQSAVNRALDECEAARSQSNPANDSAAKHERRIGGPGFKPKTAVPAQTPRVAVPPES